MISYSFLRILEMILILVLQKLYIYIILRRKLIRLMLTEPTKKLPSFL